MARKVKCKNTECKHHCKNDYCDTTVNINSGGRCESFEKNIVYYFHLVWEALADKNFIDMVEIIRNPEIKIGLFYVMECFNLGFAEMEWGTCRMVMLKDGKDGKPLNYEEITSREIDTDKLRKHMENLNNGILPGTDKKPKEVEEKEFGWLSPTGEFTESPFGEHEESAEEICEKKGFETEYRAWRMYFPMSKLMHQMILQTQRSIRLPVGMVPHMRDFRMSRRTVSIKQPTSVEVSKRQ